MTEKQAIKILVVDDHTIFVEALSILLSSFNELKLITSVVNGQEALNILKHHTIDVVITDLSMPVMDGIQLTKEIKKKYPDIHVLALTMHNESRMISAMIKSGVSGYILKDTNKEELLTAIKTVAKGESFFSEEVKDILEKNTTSPKKSGGSNLQIQVSEREFEILKLIAGGYTNQQIGDKVCISANTVIFHRKNLCQKFDAKNTAELIKSASDKGFL